MVRLFGTKANIVFLLALALATAAGCADSSSSGKNAPPTANSADEQTLATAALRIINREREAGLIRPLEWDDTLAGVAREYAMSMANNNFLKRFDETGRGLAQRLVDAQIVYIYAGENVACGFTSAEEVVNGWMKSNEHCKNILCPEYSRTGIALAGPGQYWVQIFAGP